jgi:hypothetical protein
MDRKLSSSADSSGHEPPLHHMLCVAAIKDPQAKSSEDLVDYLNLFHAGMFIAADVRDWSEILEVAAIPAVITNSVDRDIDVGFLSADLSKWSSAILRGCNKNTSKEVRVVFNKVYNEFKKIGLAGAFKFRKKDNLKDNTFLLEYKP